MTEYPAAFLARMRTMLGDEYEAFEAALGAQPERGVRLNPLRGLDMPGDVVPWEPNGRYGSDALRPGQDLAHFSGAYYMQDPSAMAPAQALSARPGELVLDLCAAPGGKSGQIAAALQGRGALVSNEPDFDRAKALAGNLERLGAPNALVVSAYPDALARRWPEAFDAILVDAPCSGEGMFRRDAAARAEWSEASPEGCARRQAQILTEAAKMLRPGGRLVYSTCTFNEVENEGVVRGFLAGHGEFMPVDFALDGIGASRDGMLRLWPHRLRGEGHFVAMVAKAGGRTPSAAVAVPLPQEGGRGEATRSIASHANSAPREEPPAPLLREGDRASGGRSPSPASMLEQLTAALPGPWPALIDSWTLAFRGDTLCALPPSLPSFDGLKTLRTGLHLCRVGKGYIRPDHALAMSLSPAQLDRTLDLDTLAARRFAGGEEIRCPEPLSGWTLVTHANLPLGWGKAVQGAMKNHVPKGIRMS